MASDNSGDHREGSQTETGADLTHKAFGKQFTALERWSISDACLSQSSSTTQDPMTLTVPRSGLHTTFTTDAAMGSVPPSIFSAFTGAEITSVYILCVYCNQLSSASASYYFSVYSQETCKPDLTTSPANMIHCDFSIDCCCCYYVYNPQFIV